jgi:hypothetical protein
MTKSLVAAGSCLLVILKIITQNKKKLNLIYLSNADNFPSCSVNISYLL